MSGNRVPDDQRKRARPKSGEEWHTILSGVHKHLVMLSTNDAYTGGLDPIITKWLKDHNIRSSSSAIETRLSAGGWLTYDDKKGGTSNWVVRPATISLQDAIAANALVLEEAKRRNHQRGLDSRRESAPTAPVPPPPPAPAPDDHAACHALITDLERRLADHECPTPESMVSCDDHDTTIADLEHQLADAKALIKTLMGDPKSAELIRTAIRMADLIR